MYYGNCSDIHSNLNAKDFKPKRKNAAAVHKDAELCSYTSNEVRELCLHSSPDTCGECRVAFKRPFLLRRRTIMMVISIAAVTAGGKTTAANKLTKLLPNSQVLHFDAYTFEGEVDDFYQWVLDGADYHVWNLKPLENDIIRIKNEGNVDYLMMRISSRLWSKKKVEGRGGLCNRTL